MRIRIRKSLAAVFVIAVVFAGGYWYYTAEAVCHVPISYRIGTIDPKFGVSAEDVRAAASVAESLWEDGTGRNLFTYDANGDVAINLVYDDRQKNADLEANLRSELDQKESKSESIKTQYDHLLENYDDLKAEYEKRKQAYETNLAAHNAEVERWNKAGGAPQDIYQNLLDKQAELKKEQDSLNTIAYQLDQLVKQINALGAQGNNVINGYNEIVDEYNTQFGSAQEFTQGEYKDEIINVYEFGSTNELEIVLAHEFGHALSLDHVEGSSSIMFHFMQDQSLKTGITMQDKAEFERVCGTGKFTLWSIL